MLVLNIRVAYPGLGDLLIRENPTLQVRAVASTQESMVLSGQEDSACNSDSSGRAGNLAQRYDFLHDRPDTPPFPASRTPTPASILCIHDSRGVNT
jgi:hypothetical protein